MEFEGKIVRVLPAREGVSQQSGNAWKTLPFVFEFFTPENQQWPERVLLETFDTNIQRQIAPYCKTVVGEDQKPKVMLNQYGDVELLGQMAVRIGFSLKVRNGKRQDGSSFTVNDIRIYKFEAIQPGQQQQQGQAVVAQPQTQQAPQFNNAPVPPQYQPQAPFPPQQPQGGQGDDDLPF